MASSSSAPPVVLVTRPAEDAPPLLDALRRRGYAPLLTPMLRIVPRDDAPLDMDGVDGLLFTSANGVRALVRRVAAGAAPFALPVYAVGDATARAARAAGFSRVDSAGGDVTTLAALVAARRRPADGPLLHVAGADLAGDLAGLLIQQGFTVRRAALYQAVAADRLDAATRAALGDGNVTAAAFFSPRTARAFVSLAAAAGALDACAGVVACCLSDAVAAALQPAGWRELRVAAAPTQDALLDLLPPLTADGAGGGRTEF